MKKAPTTLKFPEADTYLFNKPEYWIGVFGGILFGVEDRERQIEVKIKPKKKGDPDFKYVKKTYTKKQDMELTKKEAAAFRHLRRNWKTMASTMNRTEHTRKRFGR